MLWLKYGQYTGDEVIYFDFVSFYKKSVGEILILQLFASR